MDTERTSGIERRAAVHAALAEPARLHIVDLLTVGDMSPSELSAGLAMPSNLVAHHLNVLESSGLIARGRSEGDRRRTYLKLVPGALDAAAPGADHRARRVLFVCTANTARSHLAAALWRRESDIPVASAGTRPADRIDPGAVRVALRHQLPLPRRRPRSIDDVLADGDLVVTVCDLAHEAIGRTADLHWSVPDPVRVGNEDAFDRAFDELARRVRDLAPHLTAA